MVEIKDNNDKVILTVDQDGNLYAEGGVFKKESK